jgi:hypothetical protein
VENERACPTAQDIWLSDITSAINSHRRRTPRESFSFVERGSTDKREEERLAAVKRGGELTKFSYESGKPSQRWVVLSDDGKRLCWGDPETKRVTSSSEGGG